MDKSREPEKNHKLKPKIEREKIDLPKFTARLQGNVVLIKNPDALQEFYNRSYIGIKLEDKTLELTIEEALLLLERERIEIVSNDGKLIIAAELLSKIGKTDQNIWLKYLVYRDLRQRGYIVRKGFGESIDFRVFPRGATHSEDIAKHFIFILDESNPVRLEKLHKMTQQSLKSRKDLILAVVDRLGEPTYYTLDQYNLPINKKKEKNW